MNDIANNDEKKKGGPKGIHKVTVNTSYFDQREFIKFVVWTVKSVIYRQLHV